MRVANIEALRQLIFNGYIKMISLGFTFTGSDCYGCWQNLVTKEIYVQHGESCFYKYDSIDDAKTEYKELGYQISFDLI